MVRSGVTAYTHSHRVHWLLLAFCFWPRVDCEGAKPCSAWLAANPQRCCCLSKCEPLCFVCQALLCLATLGVGSVPCFV